MKMLYRVAITLSSILFISFASNASIIISDGETVGDKGNEVVTFSFSGLEEHDQILINFDLFIQDSWDGSGSNGPDRFGFRVDGVEIFSGLFNNFNAADNPAGAIPTLRGDFNNFNNWADADQYFDDFLSGFVISHTGSTLDISFFGSGLQGIFDESWRVNDLDVSSRLSSDIPAPASTGLILLGLALLAFRRFKAK